MDHSGRPYPGVSNQRTAPLDASFSIVDLSGAPPAYVRYDQASSSLGRDSQTSLSTKPASNSTTDYYYAGTGAHKGSRSANKYTTTRDSQRDTQRSPYTAAGCRTAAPDYSVTGEGELLSEKDPRAQATQTHQSISHTSPHHPRSPCGTSPTSSMTRPQYPPTASRDESSPLCGCFNSLPPKVKLWLSFGAWIATSIGFLLAVAFWKTEVFTALDNLSEWLVAEGETGYAYMFALIVLTTIRTYSGLYIIFVLPK